MLGKRFLPATLLAALPATANAHVKWFSDYSFSEPPLRPGELLGPSFYLLAALSVLVIVVLVVLEDKASGWRRVRAIEDWFAAKSGYAMAAMRIGVGATLVWSWQSGTLLAPDLGIAREWILWIQFLVAFLLIFPKTVPLAGAGIILLYLFAIGHFGFFHMLDYLLFLGVGYYFIAANAGRASLRATALPAVYATLGFCLLWLGAEKMIYPTWSKLLLNQHPVLALGFDHDFFVLACAFIEMSLGFMIMICLQQRLLALFVTLLFFLTTLVFGRSEVVGHTLIHAVLIVFILAGAGNAIPPLHWLKKLAPRAAAAALLFLVLVAGFLVPYSYGARMRFESGNLAIDRAHGTFVPADGKSGETPGLAIAVHKDPVKGWNLEIVTENFRFAPSAAGLAPVRGEGHAHLFIDGRKVARLYGPWYHLPNLTAGRHEIAVTLNNNNHGTLTVRGKPVRAAANLEVVDSDAP